MDPIKREIHHCYRNQVKRSIVHPNWKVRENFYNHFKDEWTPGCRLYKLSIGAPLGDPEDINCILVKREDIEKTDAGLKEYYKSYLNPRAANNENTADRRYFLLHLLPKYEIGMKFIKEDMSLPWRGQYPIVVTEEEARKHRLFYKEYSKSVRGAFNKVYKWHKFAGFKEDMWPSYSIDKKLVRLKGGQTGPETYGWVPIDSPIPRNFGRGRHVKHEVEGYNARDIAEATGIPLGTIKSRFHRNPSISKKEIVKENMRACDE